MNSAVKAAPGPAGVPSAGSPAKASVAGTLVGQNLTHAGPAQPPPHAVPSMAPVSANMAQMAHNMSHHGNLSLLPPAPLGLLQDKANAVTSQPLALTRTPEKKEPDSTQANGTVDSPKSGANTSPVKPQTEPNKPEVCKTSPSAPKPAEKPPSAPSTPQKAEAATTVDGPAQPKVATANEPPEKSPSKPAEPAPAPTADVAPSQSNSKPAPEAANDQPIQATPDKPPTPVKPDPVPETPKTEPAKPETPKVEEKKPETPEKLAEDKKEEIKEKVETPKKEDQVDSKDKPSPKSEEKVEKVDDKKEVKKESKPKTTLKLATVTPPIRKRRHTSPAKDGTPAKKSADDSTPTSESRTKRNRTKVQLYQSPTPELAMATKLSASAGRSTPTKPNDDKLIVFYKNEYLAVRNAEGGFYVCQAMQNVYRTTRKIKIRWLSQDKTADPSGETYKPDFYDVTDMECVLTTLSLQRAGSGAQLLKAAERARATSILQRALCAERGGADLDLTPEHPDGLDLSLYTAESQIENKPRKRRAPPEKPDQADTAEASSPAKKPRTPKRSPKNARKSKSTPKATTNNNKRKSMKSTTGSTAAPGKTATAVTEKAKTPAKSTPNKRTPAKKAETPVATPTRGRRAAKESKPSPIVATPSTSTGKATRTPRKPPSRK